MAPILAISPLELMPRGSASAWMPRAARYGNCGVWLKVNPLTGVPLRAWCLKQFKLRLSRVFLSLHFDVVLDKCFVDPYG